MCGIFGYSIKHWDERITRLCIALAVLNESRGKDAFGWTNGKIIVKDGCMITEKFNEIPFVNELTSVFHTRAGTSGPKMGQKCAHPWEIGNTIGMHNGAIMNHDELNKKYKRDFPVDSMHAVAHINNGMDTEELKFGGVFMYFQNGEGPFMFRTFHRTLETVKLANNLGVVWSSDWEHLKTAIRLSQLPIEHYYTTPKQNNLFRFDYKGMFDMQKHIPTGNIEVKQQQQPKQTSMVRYVDDDYAAWWQREMGHHSDDGPDDTADTTKHISRPKLIVTDEDTKSKRSAEVGQWRTLPGEKDSTWVPCFHNQKQRKMLSDFQSHMVSYSCGCYYNSQFKKDWPIMWRPIGEWQGKQWMDCWHRRVDNCQCKPFTKRQKNSAQSVKTGADEQPAN